jgi:hypothetical protein
MNPYASVNGPFPETNYANVRCIFPTTGTSACSQWKFTPSGTYGVDGTVNYRNVAQLLEMTTIGRQTIAIDRGDFYMSFSIELAK